MKDLAIIVLTIAATAAALGQLVVAYRVYLLQKSNEEIANRIELFARLEMPQKIGAGLDEWRLVLSNLSAFAVWIDLVAVQVAGIKPPEKYVTVHFSEIIPSAEARERPIHVPSIKGAIFKIGLRTRGRRLMVESDVLGMAGYSPRAKTLFSWAMPILRKLDEIASYHAK